MYFEAGAVESGCATVVWSVGFICFLDSASEWFELWVEASPIDHNLIGKQH